MEVQELIKDLKNGIGMVRVNAATALGKIGGPQAENALIAVLGDQNMAVRSNAAFALGEMDAKAAASALLRLLQDPEERVRKSAVKALGLIRTKEAVAPLSDLLATEASRVVRKSIIRSLGQIGGPDALRSVTPFTTHGDSLLAETAKTALAQIRKT